MREALLLLQESEATERIRENCRRSLEARNALWMTTAARCATCLPPYLASSISAAVNGLTAMALQRGCLLAA
jgi:hypothetical protein